MHQPSTAATAISSAETRDEKSEDAADIDLSPSDLNHDGDVEKGEIVLDDTKLEDAVVRRSSMAENKVKPDCDFIQNVFCFVVCIL